MEEIWKDIKGYEGLYMINNLGIIKSLPRNGTISSERILNQYYDKYGYKYVALHNKGIKKYKVHRLVAEAFIPNPNNLPQVNHKNYIRDDNKITNLEWCDNKYNAEYSKICHKKLTTKSISEISNANTGEFYIYKRKRKGKNGNSYYVYRVIIGHIEYASSIKTLEEAIAFRDLKIEELNYQTIHDKIHNKGR